MGGGGAAGGSSCAVPDVEHRTSAFVIFVAIILGSIAFEVLRHVLEHFAPEAFLPVIEGMWAELTILGFVALVLFQLASSGWWADLSVRVFGEASALLHIAEKVHFAVFWTMVAYLVFVFVLILLSRLVKRHWERLENSVLAILEGTHDDAGVTRALMSRMDYALLRQEFLTSSCMAQAQPTVAMPPALPPEFDFSIYLYHVLARFLVRIVRLRLLTWAFLLVVFAAFYGLSSLSLKWQMVSFFVFGGLLMVAALLIRVRLAWVVKQLTPVAGDASLEPLAQAAAPAARTGAAVTYVTPPDSHGAEWNDLYELSHPPAYAYTGEWQHTAAYPASYSYYQLPEHSAYALAYKDFGPDQDDGFGLAPEHAALAAAANPAIPVAGPPPYHYHIRTTPLEAHRALFGLGQLGPRLFFRFIQILMLLTAVYAAVFLAYFVYRFGSAEDCFHVASVVIIVIVAVVPPVAMVVLLCDCSRLFCIATCVEKMRNLNCVDETNRKVKLRHTMQAMAMVYALANADGKPEQAALKPLPPGQAAQLRHTFAKFDHDRSGYIDASELRLLFQTLGQQVSEEQLGRAVAEMDPSGEGIVTIDEFCGFIAAHSASAHEQAKAIFDMIDVDGSGAVTVEEFMNAGLRMQTGLTYEDVATIIRSLDRDGSGRIDEKEFRRLYNNVMGI